MKTCNKCHIEKDESDFYPKKNRKGEYTWLSSICKVCDSENSKSYYSVNKGRIKKAVSDWQKINRDKCNANKKRWCKKHPDRVKQHTKIESIRRKIKIETDLQYAEKLKEQYRNYNKIKQPWKIQNNKDRVKKYMRKAIEEIKPIYLKNKLKREGFKDEQMVTKLIDVKKTEILIHRLKKQINGKKSINGSA